MRSLACKNLSSYFTFMNFSNATFCPRLPTWEEILKTYQDLDGAVENLQNFVRRRLRP